MINLYFSLKKKNAFVTKKGLIHHTCEEFLVNGRNSEQLITLFSVVLTQDRHHVVVCEEDAGTQKVGEATDLAYNKENATAFAEDINILPLLMYFWKCKLVY